MSTATSAPTSTITWKIDPAHSRAEFKVKHMMISNVKGSFNGVAGTLIEDTADPTRSRVEATIEISTISTGDEQRDTHLKSADFFHHEQHPVMKDHQKEYYENFAWANEIAKRGFVVLVPDAFTFASRRVMLQDVPIDLRQDLTDEDPENPVHIEAYNKWAGQHEHVMAKSLFCAGTSWPGVFFAEDQKALDILCARADVDPARVGCGGLSGGGLRTVMMAGLDPRIKCAVPVGFMSTWKDFLLNKSFTHTWMLYVPMLPKELDFPEILGLRVPLATLVLNDSEDDLYTLPEMQRADKILAEVYQKAGAANRYKCSFYPGPHKFDAKMQAEAFDWFEKWL